MPRKKPRRVISNANERAVVRVSAPRPPVVVHRTVTTSSVELEPLTVEPKPAPLSPPHTAATPAQRFFWAWYNAGVDTVRYAFDVHSVLVRQTIQVSPASLALQCSVAFHTAFQGFTTDHDRALA